VKYFLMLAAIAALSSCSKPPAKDPPATAKSVSSMTSKVDHADNISMEAGVRPSPEGMAADFSWYNREGKKVSLSDFRGKTVLINFWATWCGPCKAELPDIEAISNEYASKGLVVIGVSEDEGSNLVGKLKSFASQHGLTYQIVIDDNSIADAYGNINAIPTSFLVGKKGEILKSWVGEKDKSYFESTLGKYLY
jgi:cytochrome c biogenesis protein CcmG/thiol:disulfide interchange protein DsbE